MAIFYPKSDEIRNLKQKPEPGEIHALEVLKQLSDEYEIFFQPFINGNNPDIVIVRKGYGVIVVEVKDWELKNYQIAENDTWSLKINNIQIKSPFKQVESYKDDFYNLSIPSLLKAKILDKKNYGLVQTTVYFHNEYSYTISKILKESDFCPSFGRDNFIHENIICHKTLFRKYPNKLFSDDIYKEFKRVLKPSYHTIEQSTVPSLSKKQMELSISMDKHQKIRGVAGSGKTLVLAQRAVNSHKRHGGKVLILTYNITLRNYIHDNISRVREEFEWSNFLILHYDGFIKAQANNYNIKYTDNSDINLFERVKDKISKYKSIFIDEVQDYHEDWIRILKKYFLENNGELVVFGDEKQNIYGNELDKNKKPNTTILGAWNVLNQSFRLSNKILGLAEEFQNCFFRDKYEIEKAVPKQQSFNFEQESIDYFNLASENSLSTLVDLVASSISDNSLQPQDVCIIAHSNSLLRAIDFELRERTKQKTFTTLETHEILTHLKKQKNNARDLQNEVRIIRRNKRFNFWMNSGGIKLSTVHSFKGWEINTLFLIIDNKTTYENDEIIYTAITRCRNRLFIINLNNEKFDNFFKDKKDKHQSIIVSALPSSLDTGNSTSKSIKDAIEEDANFDTYYSFLKLKGNGKFRILVLGEISDNQVDFKEAFNSHFSKFGFKATEWDIDFWDNKTIKRKDIRSLKKGQSKYNLLVTGQIHQHSSKGNKESNLLTELMKPNYVKRIYGCRPQQVLNKDLFVEKVNEYIDKNICI